MGMLDPLHALFNQPVLRRFFVRLRLPLGLIAGGLALWFADPAWFWPGVAVSLVGAMGQWWCFACIMTSQQLAVNGPYRFVRNPMYLTRFVLVLGFIIMLNPIARWWMPVAYAVIYFLFMSNRVRREERKLAPIFGEPYQRYLQQVPRFAPSLRPFPGGRTAFWNPEAFRRNHGARNAVTVLATYAIAYVLVFHVFHR